MRFKPKSRNGFTLIELLAVVAIIGVLAAIVAPSLNNLRKGDATLAAARQLQGAVARARQLAISQHTTVYMVFAPAGFWAEPDEGRDNTGAFTALINNFPAFAAAATNVLDDQLVGYTYVTLRSIGDQPGRPVARYIDPWRKLPEGTYIAEWKFTNNAVTPVIDPATNERFNVYPFQWTRAVPFPVATNVALPTFWLPYIAFDYLGRVVKENGELLGYDEYIPLSHGSITHPRNPETRLPIRGVPSTIEMPEGNSTNSYNLVRIDWLTGRPRVETRRML